MYWDSSSYVDAQVPQDWWAQNDSGVMPTLAGGPMGVPPPEGAPASLPMGGQVATGADFGALPPQYQGPNAADFGLGTPFVAQTFDEKAPTFTAPTGVTMENDPGYQFRIDQMLRAGQRSAAAQGSVLNPGTVAALQRRVGDEASAEFSNVFNRASTTFDKALDTYRTKYGVFQGNEANRLAARQQNVGEFGQANTNALNAFTTNYGVNKAAQDDYWNRLAQLSASGQTAATDTVRA